MRTRRPSVLQRSQTARVCPADLSEALAAALLSDSTRRRGARFTGEPIRIAILDRNQLMRQALTALLARDLRIHLVGDSCDLENCIDFAIHRGAQMVLLSAGPDAKIVIRQISALAALPLGPHVLVLNGEQRPEEVLDAFRAGAFGCLPWSASVTELIDAIAMVANGMSYVQPTTAKALATQLRTPMPPPPEASSSRLDVLSARKSTVLERIARGFSGPEVAVMLGITAKTVDTYRHRIHEKLGVHHRSDYVRIALEHDMLLREPA